MRPIFFLREALRALKRNAIPSFAAYVPPRLLRCGTRAPPKWWSPMSSHSSSKTGLPELPHSVGDR